jgi:signal transduction histidine kinase
VLPPLYDWAVTVPEPAAHWLGGVERWNRAHGWASDALAALAFVVVLGGLSVSGSQGLHWSFVWVIVLIVAFAVLHLTVAFRRRWPEFAYAAASVALLVIVLAPDGQVSHPVSGGPARVPALFLPSSLVFLVVLFSVAARASAARSRAALVIALAGVGIATGTAADALRRFTAGGWLITFYLGVGFGLSVLMTWNLGRLALVRRQRAATERSEAARLAVLEERARIAREMHDIVAHSLAVIVRQAEGGAFVAGQDPRAAGQVLQTIAGTSRSALADMRGLLGVLRDPASGSGGEPGGSSEAEPVAAPQPRLTDLPRLVAGVRDSGVDAELTESGAPFAIGAAAELAVYRLAQEALTNAVKHAGPRAHVAVALRWQPQELTVEVADDGGGSMPAPAVPGAGAGLQGLRDRVAAVGGTFSATPRELGFAVRARFPRAAGPA